VSEREIMLGDFISTHNHHFNSHKIRCLLLVR